MIDINIIALASVNVLTDELPAGASAVLVVCSAPCECHGRRGVTVAVPGHLSRADAVTALRRAIDELLAQIE